MQAILKSEKGITLVMVMMMMVIILSMTGAGLFFSGLDLKVSGNFRAGTQAFYATDTGVSFAIAQLSANPTTATAAIPLTDLGNGLSYRSGPRGALIPQAFVFNGSRMETGFSIGLGTGYNPSGQLFYDYQIDITGFGPLGSAREIMAQAEFGPVPQ